MARAPTRPTESAVKAARREEERRETRARGETRIVVRPKIPPALAPTRPHDERLESPRGISLELPERARRRGHSLGEERPRLGGEHLHESDDRGGPRVVVPPEIDDGAARAPGSRDSDATCAQDVESDPTYVLAHKPRRQAHTAVSSPSSQART